MEEDLFLKKMKGVKPFSKVDTVKNHISNKKEKLQTKKNTSNTNKNKSDIQQLRKFSNYEISFGDINKDLKKGKIKIDRRLDLHGYSLLEAYEKFKKEVIKLYNNNKRCLLVITGKGLYQGNKDQNSESPKLFYGKIKNSIPSWINEDELKRYVFTYQDAGIEHGGDGAVFIYLRKKKN